MSSLAGEQKKRVKRYMVLSLTFHLVGMGLVMLSQAFFPPDPAELQLPTVQIDMLALPDQVKDMNKADVDVTLPVKENAPPPVAKEKAEEVALPAEKPRKEPKESSVKAKETAKDALAKLKEEVERQRREKDAIAKKNERLKELEQKFRNPIRGNQLNQGTSADGVLEATKNAYAGHVASKIRGWWALPTYLQSQGQLRAAVVVYIAPDGKLIRYEFRQNSGNDTFDDYVKRAVLQAAPFAPPPADMARDLRSGGIMVRFPL
ncbi:MAG: TonB C-terminal domain-containing protein [Bdellovibrionales bacterium]|nr:TonB C-terminal domain-containing protein [Bdellovibrionales bacterium]